MSVMDCQTFDSSLLDALYDELDTDAFRAMDEHAAGCEPCASRFARLTKTRALVSPALEETPPDGFEARVLAAAEAAMDAANGRASTGEPAVIVSPWPAKNNVSVLADRAEAPSRTERGGIVAFLSRSQLVAAATFVPRPRGCCALAQHPCAARSSVGSCCCGSGTSSRRRGSRAGARPGRRGERSATGHGARLRDRASFARGCCSPDSSRKREGEQPGSAEGEGEQRGWTRGGDPAFDAAKALFDADRHAEALPRFEALAPSSPLAELYAARCIEHTQGCGAAIARYDNAARRNAGNENGSRAALEAARCVNGSGQASAARSRYKALANDGYVADEAQTELDALEAPRASAKAAKPVPQHATAAPPKAAPTAPAAPPALR